MVRGKLILICQIGGEFSTEDGGSMSYAGGDAHAVDITSETLFDDLKFKLAELCNLDFNSLCFKYFLPGNKKTLITLANDKDFKRMKDFHENSVTADIFVTGTEGFDPLSLDIDVNRKSEAKQAETVTAVASRSAATTHATSKVASAGRKKSRAAAAFDSLEAGKATPRGRTKTATTSKKSRAARSISDDSEDDTFTPADTDPVSDAPPSSSETIDMSATPADTVKKRRRTASWRFGKNGPSIVSVTDDEEESDALTKRTSNRKNSRARFLDSVVNGAEQRSDNEPWVDGSDSGTLISSPISMKQLVASWKNVITGEGQDFKSAQGFREALQKYAIANRFGYKMRKNDANRVSGVCVIEGCPWNILASWVHSELVFRIKKMHETHTCGEESWKKAHPAKNWLVSIIKDRLKDSPHHKTKDIAKGILQDFGLQLNYSQVWRGIEDAREQLQGSYKEAYDQLPWYCERIEKANPGSFNKLLIGDEKQFQRLFLSFHATIQGFKNGCRPLLFLDAVSMKSKYHEMLLTATAIDGNDGIFPVAFAIVDVEDEDSWRWFLEQLKSTVSTSDPITFISDKDKGLMKCVHEVFENAHHGHSLYYLMDNLIVNLKGPFHGEGRSSLPGNMLAAARAVRPDGFKMFTEQIKQVSSSAYDWIMENEPEHWATALFKGEPFSQIIIDVSESYENWTEEARELTIIQKVEHLRFKIMELMNSRRTDSSNWSSKLTPSKEEKILEEGAKARYLKVLFSSDTLFEVHDPSINVVDLNKRECSCKMWKATRLPCRHAIAVFNQTGRDSYDYCSRYFTLDFFRTAYSESVNPISAVIDPDPEVREDAGSDDEQEPEQEKEEQEQEPEQEKEEQEPEQEKEEQEQEPEKEQEEKEMMQEQEQEQEMEMEKEQEQEEEEEKEQEQEQVQVLPPSNARAPTPMKIYKKNKTHDIIRRSVCCTRCKGVGHNKATCKETL